MSVGELQALYQDKYGSLQYLPNKHTSLRQRDMDDICKVGEEIDTYRLSCIRRILGMLWKEKMTNTEVLFLASLTNMFTLLRQRSHRWLDYDRRMADFSMISSTVKLLFAKETGRPIVNDRDVCKKEINALEINSDHWEWLTADRSGLRRILA